MDDVVAVMALVVAVQYAVIAFGVVPVLARLALRQGPVIHVARWGAAAFFAGCALTHVMIAVDALSSGGHDMGGSGIAPFWQHVVPHIAQVVGGGLFIAVARQRLALTLMTKTEARELHELEVHLRTVFDRAPVGVALFDLDDDGSRLGRVLQVNPALCRLVGHDEQALRGADLRQLLAAEADGHEAARAVDDLLGGGQSLVEFEQRYRHGDGSDVWVHVTASLTHDDDCRPVHCLVQVRDVTDDRRREAQLRHLAEHDPLTGLYNRRRFGEELDRVVATVQRYSEPAALLVVDLDHFKVVNDTYGHATGDRLLTTVAGVLTSRLRRTDVLGRLGGDEFGVLLPHTTAAGAARLAQALLQALRDEAHVQVADRCVRAGASIGVSVIAPDGGVDAERLLAQADIAMYEAKETGRDRVASIDDAAHGTARMRARLTWSERVRDALVSDGFVLWEQPVLNLATGVCDRSELLLRMIDPADGSLIAPGHFLDVAERFGQIQGIDSWVFSRAVELLELRHAAGDERTLEVNISGASLTDERLVDDIAGQLQRASFDRSRLIVEVGETAAVANVEVARTLAARLADAGCRFVLDDFGGGFGSFHHLEHLRFDGVKVHGAFVEDLPASRADRLVTEAIVGIAQGLGTEVTAQFVQNDETLALLRDLGVGFAQGHHVGVPRPVPEFAVPAPVAPRTVSPPVVPLSTEHPDGRAAVTVAD